MDDTVKAPVIKAFSAWAVVGITSWADMAAFAAFVYSCCLIAEWCWKKFIREWWQKWQSK